MDPNGNMSISLKKIKLNEDKIIDGLSKKSCIRIGFFLSIVYNEGNQFLHVMAAAIIAFHA